MEHNKAHYGDCLELMKDLSDKSINMICCDLPYGVTTNPKDIQIPFSDLWYQYERIIKDTGIICLFAQGLFYVDLVNSNRKLFRYDLIWDKMLVSGFLNAKRMPLRNHEQIAIFYKNPGTYNPQFKEGKPLHGKGDIDVGKEQKHSNTGKCTYTEDVRKGSTQKYPKSVWQYQKPHPSVALHRTEKPVSLLEELIKTYSNAGDLILDNCAGSGGGVGVAAKHTGRNFILMENDLEYIKVINERL